MKFLLTSSILLVFTAYTFAQSSDSLSLREALRKGHQDIQIRNHFMATEHLNEVSDYYTNAVGISLKYETAPWHGLQWAGKANVVFEAFSNGLNALDPITGKGAKWEAELYDFRNRDWKQLVMRWEELYLKYNWRKSYLRVGKQEINEGPLFLNRDGRMKFFLYDGAWAKIKEWDRHLFTLGWIWGAAPRGLTQWYSINDVIGLQNNGVLEGGEPADYRYKANSSGIYVFNYQYKLDKTLKIQFWNYYFDDLINTAWFQVDYRPESWIFGLQYVHQMAGRRQYDLEYNEQYYHPGEETHVLNARLGYQLGAVEVSANYLEVFEGGRFLFPRELGRENFYVSTPRNWVDGFGDVQIYDVSARYYNKKGKYWDRIDLRFQYVDAPNITDYKNNKYKNPSVYQTTLDVRLKFENWWDGSDLRVLVVWKHSPDTFGYTLSQSFYKTDLLHYKFIFNYNF